MPHVISRITPELILFSLTQYETDSRWAMSLDGTFHFIL